MGLISHHLYCSYVKNVINILLLIFLFACSKRDAVVDFKYVYIYTSLEDRPLIENVINEELFNYKYHTPEPEFRYQPIWKTYEDFLNRPNNSKLMVISLATPTDTTIDIISSHLISQFEIKENVFLVEDYFNANQILMFFNYDNINEFNNDLISHKDWILSTISNNEKNNLEKIAYRSGRNNDIELKISKEFKFNIKIPMDYQILSHSDSSEYIWIGRGYPYRWILLFEDNKEYYITPSLAWSRLSDKFNNILDVKIFDYEAIFTNNPMKIHGVYGTKLTADNNTGGPFFSKIIKDYKIGNVLVASGFVNFPGKSKVFHIKELEHILNNIEYKGGDNYE